jgi:hypothetical protein
MPKINKLQHVLIGKVMQLFRNMLQVANRQSEPSFENCSFKSTPK